MTLAGRIPYGLALAPTTRFGVHPDGRRIVIDALRVFESDISVIDDVR
jgi:hypothetical protein